VVASTNDDDVNNRCVLVAPAVAALLLLLLVLLVLVLVLLPPAGMVPVAAANCRPATADGVAVVVDDARKSPFGLRLLALLVMF